MKKQVRNYLIKLDKNIFPNLKGNVGSYGIHSPIYNNRGSKILEKNQINKSNSTRFSSINKENRSYRKINNYVGQNLSNLSSFSDIKNLTFKKNTLLDFTLNSINPISISNTNKLFSPTYKNNSSFLNRNNSSIENDYKHKKLINSNKNEDRIENILEYSRKSDTTNTSMINRNLNLMNSNSYIK